MIRDESTNAYNETKKKRKSQERQLLAFLLHWEGVTDAKIAEHLAIPQALAAARRNGLAKTLDASLDQWKLVSVGKTKSHESGKTVNVWGLVKRNVSAIQEGLF